MASPNLGQIVATTLRNRSGSIADNVSHNTALLSRLKQRGNMRPVDGGSEITEVLDYAENGSYLRYSGYDPLNITPSDVIDAASFAFKQAAVSVSISGLEELQNSGRERVHNLVSAKVKNAERTFRNNISADLYSNGSLANQIGGVQLLIADDPTTGTVGSIDRASFSFWQNQVTDFSTVVGTAPTAANFLEGLYDLWAKCVRNNDKPDLIAMDGVYWKLFVRSLQAQQRFSNEEEAIAGFKTVKFMSADVLLDGGFGGDAPASHAYFINTDFLHWRPHRDRDMVPLNPDRYSTNQDATVKLLAWAGNLTASNLSLQGVMKT